MIKSFSSDDDILSRFGGDEFVLFGKYENEASLRKKADELRLYIHKVSKDTGVPTDVTVSIGVSLFQSDGKSFDELFRMSDNALYVSKQNGRDRVTFFCDKK